jgi:hypothetical protein
MQKQLSKRASNRLGFVFLLALPFVIFSISALHAAQGSETSRMQTAAADSMQRKIDFIKVNADMEPPDPRPTTFSQTEINAYFEQRRLKMPDGVKSVRFVLRPGEATAYTRVDFDEITKNASSRHPLLMIFSGTHDVQVVAEAAGTGGITRVNVKSVVLDGLSIPRSALEMFIEKWVNPKYPSVQLDGDYKLPARIDTVRIEDRQGVVTQK